MEEPLGKRGFATRACCVVILDKGKPAARSGRKARERFEPLVREVRFASPAAERIRPSVARRLRSKLTQREVRRIQRGFLNRLRLSQLKQAPLVPHGTGVRRFEPKTGSGQTILGAPENQ